MLIAHAPQYALHLCHSLEPSFFSDSLDEARVEHLLIVGCLVAQHLGTALAPRIFLSSVLTIWLFLLLLDI